MITLTKKLMVMMAAALMMTAISQGCSSSEKASEPTASAAIESRSDEMLTIEEADALIAEMMENNSYIDVDFEGLKGFNSNLYTPHREVAKIRVALYRIYTHVTVEDYTFGLDGTPESLNLSPATYDHFKYESVDQCNEWIDTLMAKKGMSREEAFATVSPITDETNKALLSFRPAMPPR